MAKGGMLAAATQEIWVSFAAAVAFLNSGWERKHVALFQECYF